MSSGKAAQNTGSAAQKNNEINVKPFKYEEYVARKHRIQASLEKKNKIKWILPENFAKFELDDGFRPPARELLSHLIEAIGESNKSAIKKFSPGQTSSCWLIGFVSKAEKERILKQNPMILNRIKIVDANEIRPTPPITCSGKFRIHKLPPHTQLATVENYLKENIKIKSFKYKNIQYEKFKDTEIENGVISFQMSYSLEDHSKIEALIGSNLISPVTKAFFQLCGHESKCNICKNFGHLSKNCPKKDLKCSKCNKIGHTDSECNLANALKSNIDDEPENLIEEEEETENNKSTYRAEHTENKRANEDITLGGLISEIKTKQSLITDPKDNVFSTKTKNPCIPSFNTNQHAASQHQNLTTSTPVNQHQVKRQYNSTAEYFSKSDVELSNSSQASPPTNANSKKANTNTSNNE